MGVRRVVGSALCGPGDGVVICEVGGGMARFGRRSDLLLDGGWTLNGGFLEAQKGWDGAAFCGFEGCMGLERLS
jgi:hypothetical protein